MKSPLFDGNTIVAIESVFTNEVNDPFWKQLLRDFTNLFVYSETARFPMPLKGSAYSEKDLHILPVLLRRPIKEDGSFLNLLFKCAKDIVRYHPQSASFGFS